MQAIERSPAMPLLAARHRLLPLAAATLLVAPAVHAQNIGAIFESAVRNQVSHTVHSTVNGVFRSITQPSSGRLDTPFPVSADTEGRVVFYRTQSCGYCRRAAAYMNQNGIPYVERYVDRSTEYNAEFTRLGGRGVPLLVFGSRTLNGFDEGLISRYYQEMVSGQKAAYRPPQPAHPVADGGAPLAGGDALALKLAVLNVLSGPSRDAPVLVTLSSADRIVYLGEERNGLYRIASDKGEGWVDKQLVHPRRGGW